MPEPATPRRKLPSSSNPSGLSEDSYREQAAILHVDMDAFFVSVEQRENPNLKGKPVIVGSAHGRSVVLSASYEARRFGVRSAMPMALARRRCPQAIICPPRQALYRQVSTQIMELFQEITDQVEPVSVDEAFLDVSGTIRRIGPPIQTGRQIRARIAQRLGITASVGIANSKFVAKIASTQAKPDGLLVIPASETVAFLHTLPVSALWGVGAKTAQVLERLGVHTVAQLARTPVSLLSGSLGVNGEHIHRLAWGIDPRQVSNLREEKSIGAEETFAQDTRDMVVLRRELLRLAHRTGTRLRASGLLAHSVALKLRFADFSLVNRSRTLSVATDSAQVLFHEASGLLQKLSGAEQAIRLIGLRAEGLAAAEQSATQLSLGITGEPRADQWRQAEAAMDDVRRKFGQFDVRPARLLDQERSGSKRSKRSKGSKGSKGSKHGESEPGKP